MLYNLTAHHASVSRSTVLTSEKIKNESTYKTKIETGGIEVEIK